LHRCGLKRNAQKIDRKSSQVRESRSLKTFANLEEAAAATRLPLETERFNDYYSLEGNKQANVSERKAKSKPFHHSSYQPFITEYGSPALLSA